ncbi:MAG: SDR family NAD(P)-dependent oxidoreductase [candidate division Zixibacteria bacterium]|nr:SDR family NAD(P)-dependent oxidoreductase [candidate division Zixibacteria bacterium]MDH4035089.1 SDR family NAD(P)-dependent oxidoreductase [candidate division Zixibacteria bacterium]
MSNGKPSVLVTGANGFVGTRLCHLLLKEGLAVVAGVRKSSDLKSLESMNIEYRYGDVTRPESLPEMVTGVDYIVHNAGITKARNKDDFRRINEQGTQALFDAAAEHNNSVKKIVYISSLAAAGPSVPGRPVTEEDTPHPITTYGRSKLGGEQTALGFSDRLPVLSIRPPGVYGPGDREIFGFFEAVHKGIRPLIGDTKRRIQIVHVDDLARGIFLALTKETKPGAVYFIAENMSYTMAELIGLLQQACGRKGFPLKLPAPLFRAAAVVSEVACKLFRTTPMLTREKAAELLDWWEMSLDKAHNELDYRSRIPFAQGAKDTYDWYIRMGWLK